MSNISKYTVLLLFSLLLMCGCGNNSHEEKHEEHSENSDYVKLSESSVKEIGLKTVNVTLNNLDAFIKIPAKVVVNQDNEALVGSLVQGRVQKVFVKIGDHVKAGQELMLVEGLEIGEIISGYLTAKAALDFRKSNYNRQKLLLEQQVGSQKAFLEVQAEYEKALAEFNAEDKKIHSIGLNDEDLVEHKGNTSEHISGTLPVKSPIDGIVVERNVVIGQLVDGTTNGFRIINTNSVWIDGQIYESDIYRINGTPNVYFKATSSPDKIFEGTLSYIGEVIDENSRTITIRCEFNNKDGKLKPHMFGELQLPSGDKSRGIVVPMESIIKIGSDDFVFVQKDDLMFQKRQVITGAAGNESIEIKKGLSVNDKLVIKGAFYLKSELMKGELEEDEH